MLHNSILYGADFSTRGNSGENGEALINYTHTQLSHAERVINPNRKHAQNSSH